MRCANTHEISNFRIIYVVVNDDHWADESEKLEL